MNALSKIKAILVDLKADLPVDHIVAIKRLGSRSDWSWCAEYDVYDQPCLGSEWSVGELQKAHRVGLVALDYSDNLNDVELHICPNVDAARSMTQWYHDGLQQKYGGRRRTQLKTPWSTHMGID